MKAATPPGAAVNLEVYDSLTQPATWGRCFLFQVLRDDCAVCGWVCVCSTSLEGQPNVYGCDRSRPFTLGKYEERQNNLL